jgi:hypothetical protein
VDAYTAGHGVELSDRRLREIQRFFESTAIDKPEKSTAAASSCIGSADPTLTGYLATSSDKAAETQESFVHSSVAFSSGRMPTRAASMGTPPQPPSSSGLPSSSRGSWKSRLIGSNSSATGLNNSDHVSPKSDSINNNNPRRQHSSPMRRFSTRSSGDDEKKDETDVSFSNGDATTNNSLSQTRAQRSQKKSMRGRLRQLLPKSHGSTTNSSQADNPNSSRTRSINADQHVQEDVLDHHVAPIQQVEENSSGPIPRSPIAQSKPAAVMAKVRTGHGFILLHDMLSRLPPALCSLAYTHEGITRPRLVVSVAR